MKIKDLSYEFIDDLFSSILDDDEDLNSALTTIDGYYNSRMLSELFFSRSMYKSCSNLIEWIKEEIGESHIKGKVVELIHGFYKRKWLKLIDTYSYEYNALEPYHMDLHDELSKDNLTSSENTSTATTNSDTNTEQYYGFNSSNPVDVNKNSTSGNESGSRTNQYTRDRESERDISRKGNIGNKTNQQLIEEERELLKWNVYITIIKDFEKILCARIWDTHII